VEQPNLKYIDKLSGTKSNSEQKLIRILKELPEEVGQLLTEWKM
jgi:hypothetical protein